MINTPFSTTIDGVGVSSCAEAYVERRTSGMQKRTKPTEEIAIILPDSKKGQLISIVVSLCEK
jgi:hypothetical protein